MMTPRDPIAETVTSFVLEEFPAAAGPRDVTESTPLVSGGVLDSVATVKLMAFSKKRYRVTIDPHKASVDYLDDPTDRGSGARHAAVISGGA